MAELGSLVAWIIPLRMLALFLGLLSSANPLIEYRLSRSTCASLFRPSRASADRILDPDRLRHLAIAAAARTKP